MNGAIGPIIIATHASPSIQVGHSGIIEIRYFNATKIAEPFIISIQNLQGESISSLDWEYIGPLFPLHFYTTIYTSDTLRENPTTKEQWMQQNSFICLQIDQTVEIKSLIGADVYNDSFSDHPHTLVQSSQFTTGDLLRLFYDKSQDVYWLKEVIQKNTKTYQAKLEIIQRSIYAKIQTDAITTNAFLSNYIRFGFQENNQAIHSFDIEILPVAKLSDRKSDSRFFKWAVDDFDDQPKITQKVQQAISKNITQFPTHRNFIDDTSTDPIKPTDALGFDIKIGYSADTLAFGYTYQEKGSQAFKMGYFTFNTLSPEKVDSIGLTYGDGSAVEFEINQDFTLAKILNPPHTQYFIKPFSLQYLGQSVFESTRPIIKSLDSQKTIAFSKKDSANLIFGLASFLLKPQNIDQISDSFKFINTITSNHKLYKANIEGADLLYLKKDQNDGKFHLFSAAELRIFYSKDQKLKIFNQGRYSVTLASNQPIFKLDRKTQAFVNVGTTNKKIFVQSGQFNTLGEADFTLHKTISPTDALCILAYKVEPHTLIEHYHPGHLTPSLCAQYLITKQYTTIFNALGTELAGYPLSNPSTLINSVKKDAEQILKSAVVFITSASAKTSALDWLNKADEYTGESRKSKLTALFENKLFKNITHNPKSLEALYSEGWPDLPAKKLSNLLYTTRFVHLIVSTVDEYIKGKNDIHYLYRRFIKAFRFKYQTVFFDDMVKMHTVLIGQENIDLQYKDYDLITINNDI